jgi:hypothetical protein
MKIIDIKFITDRYNKYDKIDNFINCLRNQRRSTERLLSLLKKEKNGRVPE